MNEYNLLENTQGKGFDTYFTGELNFFKVVT